MHRALQVLNLRALQRLLASLRTLPLLSPMRPSPLQTALARARAAARWPPALLNAPTANARLMAASALQPATSTRRASRSRPEASSAPTTASSPRRPPLPSAAVEAVHAAAPPRPPPLTAATAAAALRLATAKAAAEAQACTAPSMILPAVLFKSALARLARARETHPYKQSLLEGVEVADRALVRRAVNAIILSRAVYLEEYLRQPSFSLEIPGADGEHIFAQVLAVQEAYGST